jgi:hypothetical protein
MKRALYLPNFRTKVTLKELEDLTSLAEDLDFDSVWTLDRIVVPEASDRSELQHSFGMMGGLPKALPVASRGEWFQGMPLIPWLAAKMTKVRIGMSITDTPFRAPGVLAAGDGDDRPPLGRQAQRRRRGRLDARGVRGRERVGHLPAAARSRARDDRDHAGHLDGRPLRVPRRVRAVRVRGQAAAGPAADLLQRAQGPEAIGTAGQITDRLKAYKEAGLTMPMFWPPFADVPVSKTLDDLKRLKEEILPKVEAS